MANKRALESQKAQSRGSRATSPAPARCLSGATYYESGGVQLSSPQEQSKNQIDFQFLNFSHPSDAKASRARRAVRSHVTRQQHQREHALQAARRAKSYQSQGSEPEDLPPRREHAQTLPSNQPVSSEQPGMAAVERTSSPEASSGSPSPTTTPTVVLETCVDPSELYPEEWHPYIPRVMVGCHRTPVPHDTHAG